MRLNKLLLPLAIIIFIGCLSLVFSMRSYQISQSRQEVKIAVLEDAISCSDNFSDDFSGASVDTAKWDIFKNGSGTDVKIESGKVALSLAVSTPDTNANLATKKSLTGDFILEVDSSSLVRTGSGTSGAVVLLPIDSSGSPKGLTLARKSRSVNSQHLLSARLTLSGGSSEENSVSINANSVVTWKVERKAGVVKVDYKTGADYQNLLTSAKNFPDEIDFVSLSTNHLGIPRPETKAVFDNVKIYCPSGTTSPSPSPSSSPSPSASANPSGSPAPSASVNPNQASFIINKFLDANKNGVRETGEGPTNRAWEFTYQINGAEKKAYTIEPGVQSGPTIYVDKGSKVKVEELGQEGWLNTTGASVEKTLLENKVYNYYFGNWSVNGTGGPASPSASPSAGGFPPTQPNTGTPTGLTIGAVGIGAILLMLKLML